MYIMSPEWSALGQPYEAQLLCTALLMGELLGHTWEAATREIAEANELTSYKPLEMHEPVHA